MEMLPGPMRRDSVPVIAVIQVSTVSLSVLEMVNVRMAYASAQMRKVTLKYFNP